jgi:hypothetical protein
MLQFRNPVAVCKDLLQEREKRSLRFLETPATGLTNDAIGYQRTGPKKSSPGGENTGEGGLSVDAQRRSIKK